MFSPKEYGDIYNDCDQVINWVYYIINGEQIKNKEKETEKDKKSKYKGSGKDKQNGSAELSE